MMVNLTNVRQCLIVVLICLSLIFSNIERLFIRMYFLKLNSSEFLRGSYALELVDVDQLQKTHAEIYFSYKELGRPYVFVSGILIWATFWNERYLVCCSRNDYASLRCLIVNLNFIMQTLKSIKLQFPSLCATILYNVAIFVNNKYWFATVFWENIY